MLKEDRASHRISPVERLNMLVAADMTAADRLIRKGMASSVELIPDLARHLIESGGKRLRPLLTLAAATAGGYQGDGHIRLAAAVEFIHTATLLHDDVVDESTLRRGKVSANLVWGNKPPVLVGDFLFVSKLSYGPRIPMTPLSFPFTHNTLPGSSMETQC